MTQPDHLRARKGPTPWLSHSPCQAHLGTRELNAPAKPPGRLPGCLGLYCHLTFLAMTYGQLLFSGPAWVPTDT